jgi:hypothetical protein
VSSSPFLKGRSSGSLPSKSYFPITFSTRLGAGLVVCAFCSVQCAVVHCVMCSLQCAVSIVLCSIKHAVPDEGGGI